MAKMLASIVYIIRGFIMTDKHKEVETTGHVWDEDVREYNNPLPRWWLWSFYATIIFSVAYWIYYPTWPVGTGFTRGIATVTVNGQEKDWNTRTLLEKDINESSVATSRKATLKKISELGFADIEKDPELSGAIRAMGTVLFADNCGVCHGRGGQGVAGVYPSLVDDAWIWGSNHEQIMTTITKGRIPVMTAFKDVLSDAEIMNVSHYVLSLSGEQAPADSVVLGKAIFEGKGTCFACHTATGKGTEALGAPNLADKVWETFDFAAAKTPQEKLALIEDRVRKGVPSGSREMVGWEDRLSLEQIKVLTSYVRQLGIKK